MKKRSFYKRDVMSGRGGRGGRGGRSSGGRGGRGDGRRPWRQSELKFHPHGVGTDRQTVTFGKVKERIVMKVQKDYEYGQDIAESLREMEMVDLSSVRPTIQDPTEVEPAKRAREERMLDIIYREEMSIYLKRVAALEANLGKAYSLIYENYCDNTMQMRIKEHPDYHSEILNNPIRLLEEIGKLMHEPIRAQFSYMSMMEAHRRLLNLRQKDKEGLLDYVERFRQEKSIVRSHLGEDFLDHFVEQTPEYKKLVREGDKLAAERLKKTAFETYTTAIFMANGDRSKYGQLIDGFSTQYALGNDQYPRTLQGAVDVMRRQKRLKSESRAESRNNSTSTGPNTTPVESSFAQGVKRCYCCGSTEHLANNCPERGSKPRNEWFDRRSATQHHQTESRASNQDNNANRNESSGNVTGWSGFQKATVHAQRGELGSEDDMRNVFMLDSGTTISLFCNRDLVHNVRDSKEILNLTTNAGSKIIDKEADVKGFGTVKYDEDSIANIFGLQDLVDRYRVTMDSTKENAFLVHTDRDGIVKFKANGRGLYTYQPTEKYIKEMAEKNANEVSHVQTVKENRKGFSQREYERAVEARRLMHTVGAPTAEELKSVLRQNVIANCPVRAVDVDNAEKIFGPDVAALKGKSTRPKPPVVIDDHVDIPQEILENNAHVELCMDIMFVNELPFLTTIDRQIKFRSLVPMESRTSKESFKRIDMVLRHYNKAGFTIKRIYCDGEFKNMMDIVSDELGIDMNYANPDEHVPEIERSIRVIKERFRTAYYRLPYSKIPKTMIKYLAMKVTSDLNLFPVKGGVSDFYSPNVILSRQNLDYKKHCRYEFGSYVQASQVNNPSNTNRPRTIDGIYLRPTKTIQGGHEIMDLSTGRVITRPKVTVIPISDIIKKKVEDMATEQGIKSLKFFNRKKEELFHDTDMIAGVVPDVDSEESDNEDQDSYNEDEEENEHDTEQDKIDDLLDDEERQQPKQHTPIKDEDVTEDEDDDNEDENEDDTDDDEDEEPNQMASRNSKEEDVSNSMRRSTRTRSQPTTLSPIWEGKSYLQAATGKETNEQKLARIEVSHNLVTQAIEESRVNEYTEKTVKMIARSMDAIRHSVMKDGVSFAQQYFLKKGLDKFGKKGREAAIKELDQLYRRNCFEPVLVKELSSRERMKAQETLLFLTENRDGTIKGRAVYNGKPTRDWLSKEDANSPTAALESVMLTATIDAHEGRDVMVMDIPNAFIQATMPEPKEGEDRVTMKITGVLVDMMIEIAPETYGQFVVYENGRKVIYVVVLKAIYGMLQAALLWYKKFRGDLEEVGFKFNGYDPCVANKMVSNKQQTIRFHVDDVMSSHVNKAVNDKFLEWANTKYGEIGEVKASRGKKHDYLGMTFDFSEDKKVKISMKKYTEQMVKDFSVELDIHDTMKTPAGNNLFEKGSGKILDRDRKEEFHNMTARGLFMSKRSRPDIQQTISVLCTRVQDSNESDWKKLTRMMKYLNGSADKELVLSAKNLQVIKWYVDASFAVHPDFKSHTGAVMTMGRGAIQSISRKQKLNTRSSTEAELIGVDDAMVMILWTKLFLEEQGYGIKENILYQDNKSAILLEKNGRKSAGKQSRALNIRYFFVTDQVEKGNLVIDYCPTEEMVGDFMTKPLQGESFKKFRKMILGE